MKKIGRNVHHVKEENKDIPVLFVRLKEDLLVDVEDVEYTKSFFNNVRERLLPYDSIHLTHDFDYPVADLIGDELDFFGFDKILTKSNKGIKKSKKK